ncbi:MAG: 50S ribosomal protein L17 [Nitrospirae bacterium]|nr:50S ribosomal protein L17 [Nitrospirota bacterium]
MRHRMEGRKLGRTGSHRKSLLSNLVKSLFAEERIKTTEAKGKEVRSLADRLITLGKKGELAARREAARVVRDKKILSKLFNDIAPRFAERQGGYTRLIKLSPRLGDAASLVLVELVELVEKPEKKKKKVK